MSFGHPSQLYTSWKKVAKKGKGQQFPLQVPYFLSTSSWNWMSNTPCRQPLANIICSLVQGKKKKKINWGIYQGDKYCISLFLLGGCVGERILNKAMSEKILLWRYCGARLHKKLMLHSQINRNCNRKWPPNRGMPIAYVLFRLKNKSIQLVDCLEVKCGQRICTHSQGFFCFVFLEFWVQTLLGEFGRSPCSCVV